MKPSDYDTLTADEIKRRLAAAEDVCLMFGWTAARGYTDRDKAASELWMRWADLVGDGFTDPDGHEDLDEVALAAARDAKRDQTLARIREEGR